MCDMYDGGKKQEENMTASFYAHGRGILHYMMGVMNIIHYLERIRSVYGYNPIILLARSI